MITTLHVNGFRSLVDFRFTIQPGINILVGPNGAGKTNIISLFRFLANLASSSLSEAVSNAGGAGLVFQKIGDRDYVSKLEITVVGEIRNAKSFRSQKEEKIPHLYYSYSVDISLSERRDFIFFSAQKMAFLASQHVIPAAALPTENSSWHFCIELSASETSTSAIRFLHHNLEGVPGIRLPPRTGIEEFVRQFFSEVNCKEYSLLVTLPYQIWPVMEIRRDLYAGEIFNIDPHAIKKPEDATRQPGIGHDGSGLAATLFFLKQLTFEGERQFLRHRQWEAPVHATDQTYQNVISYLRLVNSSIDSLEIESDPFDNRLKVASRIKTGPATVSLPFSAMSDGTVKWLSLITAILTYPSVLAIEEPENFLHPAMQSELINILREAPKERARRSFVLMSTHSETLLNAADPDEVMVVSMVDGRTVATRPKNRRRIREQIKESGFGLGFYFVTGALDDA